MHRSGVTIVFVLLMMSIVVACSFVWSDHYLWVSFVLVLTALLLFIFRFEKRKLQARELVLLAVLAAVAAVSRIPFASIPSVQPTSFVIMMSGFVFGAESGMIIGIVAALASNMILGQGPWTPWQMMAWGLIGLTAGLWRNHFWLKTKIGKVLFAFAWGFLFGWIMNAWGVLSFIYVDGQWNFSVIIPYFIGSAFFDLMHAISNVLFLLLFGGIWMKILGRFKKKYGLLD
ncbi:ECF transporter S component [Bacillus sp. JCM 19034]|uniref:ECF transporter S component n=1 Tax=Bacillus sp. JCM 19034 TaxID=1481928 RepID=UPI0007810A1B|nr:ECF transporter S component [Bacillus sp. JCM 19034]